MTHASAVRMIGHRDALLRRLPGWLQYVAIRLTRPVRCSRRAARAHSPQLEQLGDRVLPSASPVSVSVSDYRYSTFDQGVDSSETLLTPANVQSNFGRLWKNQQIEGQVYAQPVYIPNLAVTVNGTTTIQDTLIIGTQLNMLYWVNADTGATLREVNLNQFGLAGATVTAVPSADVGTGTTNTQIYPWIGILSTPAYDAATNNLYVVAYKKELIAGQVAAHYVYDLEQVGATAGVVTQSTIADTSYAGSTITYSPGSPSVPGNGAGSVSGTVYFDARLEGQRPAVMIVKNTIGNKGLLVGFEGHDDTGNYHGWELTISTSTLQIDGVLCTTPNGQEGGVWRSPIADSAGNIWIVVGNGTFDTQAGPGGMPINGDIGDTVAHLQYTAQGLQVVDYFTPANQQYLSDNDLDLDAGGLVMLPGEEALIAVGKDGSIYVMNPFAMGHFHPAGDQVVQELLNVLPPPSGAEAVFTEPTFFNNTLYVSVANGHAYAFSYTPGSVSPLSSSPTQSATSKFGYPGVTDTVSASGTANGIIWTLNAVTGLQAYSVSAGLGSILYSSTAAAGRDQAPDYVKFTVPVVADGMVFVAGDGEVAGYGLLSAGGSQPSQPPENADTDTIVALRGALGLGTTVRLEANGQLWLDRSGGSVLLDDHCRDVVAAPVDGFALGIFDLKNDSSNLYSFDGTQWQLVDSSARQIARAVLPDDEIALLDLKAASTDLYALTLGGWQLLDDGAGQIAQGVAAGGAPAVFDLKAGSTHLYAFSTTGWQLMDDGAGSIGAGVLSDGSPAVFDLKAHSADLYVFTTLGWQPANSGLGAATWGLPGAGRNSGLGSNMPSAFADPFDSSTWHLLDDGAGTIGEAVTQAGELALFDLKANTTNLYALGAAGWQLLDNGAGEIAAAVMPDGRPTLFDLQAGTTDLYALTAAGWQLVDDGAGQIYLAALPDGRPALFDHKAGSTALYSLSTSGWQLVSG
jgi:hypothetical protein